MLICRYNFSKQPQEEKCFWIKTLFFHLLSPQQPQDSPKVWLSDTYLIIFSNQTYPVMPHKTNISADLCKIISTVRAKPNQKLIEFEISSGVRFQWRNLIFSSVIFEQKQILQLQRPIQEPPTWLSFIYETQNNRRNFYRKILCSGETWKWIFFSLPSLI